MFAFVVIRWRYGYAFLSSLVFGRDRDSGLWISGFPLPLAWGW